MSKRIGQTGFTLFKQLIWNIRKNLLNKDTTLEKEIALFVVFVILNLTTNKK